MSIDMFVKKSRPKVKTSAEPKKNASPPVESQLIEKTEETEQIEYEEQEVKVKYHYIYQYDLTEFENAALKMLSYPKEVFPLSLKTIQRFQFPKMDLIDVKYIMDGLMKKLGDKIKYFESWNGWNEDFYEISCDRSEFQNIEIKTVKKRKSKKNG